MPIGPALFCLLSFVQSDDTIELIGQLKAAIRNGDGKAALAAAQKIAEKEPNKASSYFERGRAYSMVGEPEKAIADFSKTIALDKAGESRALSLRGGEYFKVGKIKESIQDFDREIKDRPEVAEDHWRRGIALYYADRFEDGAKQFELGAQVFGNDVENAFWAFLCLARKEGIDKARAQLLNVKEDRRYYMPAVYELIAGRAKPDDVFAAVAKAAAKDKTEGEFYANLYVGLYYEAAGDAKKGLDHVKRAAEKYKIGHYMYDVAKVHVALREKK